MLQAIFVEHPRSLGESYGKHLSHALRFSLALLGAGTAALVHGLVPCLFQTTASQTVARLNERMGARLAHTEPRVGRARSGA